MIQINSYSISASGQKVTKNLSSKVRRLDFELYGGSGGNTSNFGSGGKGGYVSGTYYFSKSEPKYVSAHPGENGDDNGGGDGIIAESYFASGGSGASSTSYDTGFGGTIGPGADGGAMSSISVDSLLAIAGGGGGQSLSKDQSGAGSSYNVVSGGGGGSPGGLGNSGANGGNDGKDGEELQLPFSFGEGLGGDAGQDASANANSTLVSNISTGTTSSTPRVDITTYGLPDPITDLTTSISPNYYPLLSWSAANNGITQRIYRRERSESSYSQVGTTNASSGTFTDTSTGANKTYSYKIVQDNDNYQESNISIIHTPDERVQVYRNGSWEPATLHTY